jgi:hypothetical protein
VISSFPSNPNLVSIEILEHNVATKIKSMASYGIPSNCFPNKGTKVIEAFWNDSRDIV